jgi:hypothetical protein
MAAERRGGVRRLRGRKDGLVDRLWLIEFCLAVSAVVAGSFGRLHAPYRVLDLLPVRRKIDRPSARIPLEDGQPDLDDVVFAQIFRLTLRTAKARRDCFGKFLCARSAAFHMQFHAIAAVRATGALKVWVIQLHDGLASTAVPWGFQWH